MTLELWTVFAAVLLPYAPYLAVGAHKRQRGIYDPAHPRDSNALLEGWSARAKAAELNSWEALSAYLAVAWIANELDADEAILAPLGVAWVISRLVYVVVYAAGYGRVRAGMWFVSVALILARFVVALTG